MGVSCRWGWVLGQAGKGCGAVVTGPGCPMSPSGPHDQLLNSSLDPSEVEKAKEGAGTGQIQGVRPVAGMWAEGG